MFARCLSSVASVLVFTACSEDSAPSAGPTLPPASSQVASVVIAPLNVLVANGDTLTLTASTRDISGAPLPGRRVVWSSEAPDIVSVSISGQIRALAPRRSVRITASSEGASGTATVTTGN
jgi:Bacterial Ig-like domain (group 2)